MRIHKFLSLCGVASRRKSEEMIRQQRVDVNGVTAQVGTEVDPDRDRVQVDGVGVHLPRMKLYLMMHKPRETMSTADDPEGRRTVYSLLPKLPVTVHSVGRLDFLSEGLLLFTNDGELTAALTRPSSGLERVYEVKIQGVVPQWAMDRLARGVRLEDGIARPASVSRLRDTKANVWLRIVLTEGRWREVRRMCQAVKLNVLKLKRVAFGPVRLGRLAVGDVRELTAEEVSALKAAVVQVPHRNSRRRVTPMVRANAPGGHAKAPSPKPRSDSTP